jgi:hypothetical protein
MEMARRERIDIEINEDGPERIRIYSGSPQAPTFAKDSINTEEVFEYLWLVLRVPPELAAVKVAEIHRSGESLWFEYDRLPDQRPPAPPPIRRPQA